jgi:hypothetical protein
MDNLAADKVAGVREAIETIGAAAISAAVFAELQSNRTELQQSESASAPRRQKNRATLSQNRPDCPLL